MWRCWYNKCYIRKEKIKEKAIEDKKIMKNSEIPKKAHGEWLENKQNLRRTDSERDYTEIRKVKGDMCEQQQFAKYN